MTGDPIGTILVASHERDVTEQYQTWLEPRHVVRTVRGGAAVLEAVDETVDLVLLDGGMPGHSGEDLLAGIRDSGLDCRVVVVGETVPDVDAVELPFDDYLAKPVQRADLVESVEELIERDAYDETVSQYFALASKKAALEVEKSPTELRNSERYHTLEESVRVVEAEAETVVSGFENDFETLFRDVQGPTEETWTFPGGLTDISGG